MPASDIIIKGAREHNLRSVNLVLPRNKLICLTGVSGSGKSSLAFDTLYAEGQRRYVESLSSFARHFLGQMPKPDVDFIGGLSPSISISQKSAGNNPRSTVGTITEIYDYLRVLYARVGTGHCSQCGEPITAQTRDQIIQQILDSPLDTNFVVLAPLIRRQKGAYRDLFEDLLKQGFVRARVDGDIVPLTDDLQLDRQMRHNIEVVVDRLTSRRDTRPRLAEAVDLALKIGKGNLIIQVNGQEGQDAKTATSKKARKSAGDKRSRDSIAAANRDIIFSADYACSNCGISFDPPSPQLFSFNSPQGMCNECDGLGEAYTFDIDLLVPNPELNFQQGCFELVGRLRDLGRWRRCVYQGVADTIERLRQLDAGTMLETPWQDLPKPLQDLWIWGTGSQHITFTWRGGSAPRKYGGTFDGIIPELLSKYANCRNRMQQRKLENYMRSMLCPDCGGQRLNAQARAVRVTSAHRDFAAKRDLDGKGGAADRTASKSLPEVCELAVAEAARFFSELQLDPTRQHIAQEAVKEIRGRLGFLMNVGLDYLTLNRTAPTLSGGESQRIRLAGQIGCGLVGVLYILDEPSIGLHSRDNDRLLATLAQLRDAGNTVVVVEHDEDTMLHSDHIIDFGPGPGVRGGKVVAQGAVEDIKYAKHSVTGQYLARKQQIEIPISRRPRRENRLKIIAAAHNNLKEIDVEIPLGAFVCVTGVSGSGKSSLVNDILVEALRRDLNRGDGAPGAHGAIEGLEHLDKLIAIDQTPIGRTPRSNPATYIKVFDEIRKLYTQMPEAKRRGYKPGRFSFNVEGGRCEACDGNGSNRLQMDFLADVWMTCPVCAGRRFNRETLGVKFKDASIADVLEMDIQQAMELFENLAPIHHKLQTLHDVGLDYLHLGQPSPTLSGGEAQRVKLARELVKKSTGRTLYLLDEPTTGLHFADIKMLLKVLHGFVNAGNTVLVVEHNLEVIKTADWIIDLGPEGGAAGGQIVAAGTPEEVARNKRSHTGRVLAGALSATAGTPRASVSLSNKRPRRKVEMATTINVQGARQHNLKDVNASIPRDELTVFCGPSGSGKSSLAMDTVYAEGQRRYVESLSAYARQFVSQMQKPDVEHVEGLSPAIAIEQKNLSQSPRSTVGTTTEIYDYLRILMARLGKPHCPDCNVPIGTQSADEVIDKIMRIKSGTRLYLMSPVYVEVGEDYERLWQDLRADGFLRVRVDSTTHSLDNAPQIDRRRRHRVETVVDRVEVRAKNRSRIAESVEAALSLGQGVLHVAYPVKDMPEKKWHTVIHSQHLACDKCGRSFELLTPHSFSFNSHLGWCSACEGLGMQTGANPASLLANDEATLRDGVLLLWPNLKHNVAAKMLDVFSRQNGIPLDVPFQELAARERRILFHGTGDAWYEVHGPGRKRKNAQPIFRFQFKGIYPALDEAARLSPALRGRLSHLVDEVECSACGGSRLRDDASATRLRGVTIDQLCRLPLARLHETVAGWRLSASDKRIAGELIREIRSRTKFLNDVGLGYLTLARTAASLSGGEAQRIRLASQLGSGLCGVLYVLDEPTIGLHPRDNKRLIGALHGLRDLGNTLVLVEHDREVIAGSDNVLDFGPRAGKQGGEIVAQGSPDQLTRCRGSVTGPYLSGAKAIPVPSNRRYVGLADAKQQKSAGTQSKRGKSLAAGSTKNSAGNSDKPILPGGYPPPDWLTVRGARHHNLKNINVRIPLGRFTTLTGPSGSGKSSLLDDVLYAELAKRLHRANIIAGGHDAIEGIEHINKVIRVNQQPLGNSPTSNPATYTGAFEHIRKLFSFLPESRLRGYSQRRFSFNAPGGRCEECEGNGQLCIEMHFLPDVWVTCDACHGARYNQETLQVLYHGRSIADVLDMTCGDAVELFANIPKIRRILQTLCDVGLNYLTLGQPAPTLSGGEAQRVRLASELSRPDTGRTLYLLDEPTTGLHFDDLSKLLDVLQRLVDLGNTVVVIEHNSDVIKSADWVIDMGPEAGADGGQVVAAGTPEDIVRYARLTGRRKTPANGTTNGSDKKANRSRRGKGSPSKKPAGTCLVESGLRSHTGEALGPVLQAGPLEKRQLYTPEATEKQDGELDIQQVGSETKMPWQIDGRAWHTKDRVDRRGKPVRWDGRILAAVVDRIHELGEFSETNWDSRSIVEIAAAKKSDGWFLHAITAETWLLKLKFRVSRNTFKRNELRERLKLKTLNQMDDLPVYGNEPRVKCKNLRGPFQEVELRLHDWAETDTPEFWRFVEQCVAGFDKHTQRVETRPEDIMPWKKLGKRWHFSRKGFPPGKRVVWPVELLEELVELLSEKAEDGQFLWNNQQVVRLFVPGQKDAWASVITKRATHVELILSGPKGGVTLGRIAELGRNREFDGTRDANDFVRMEFHSVEDLHRGDLSEFLDEHIGLLKATAK